MNKSLRVCVDASVVVRFFVTPQDQVVQSLWNQWGEKRFELVAPLLIRYEVANALYRYERQGVLSPASVARILQSVLLLPLRLHVSPSLHLRAVEVARRFGLAACYDSHYLALSEQLDCELWTCDHKLVRKIGNDFHRLRFAGESSLS